MIEFKLTTAADEDQTNEVFMLTEYHGFGELAGKFATASSCSRQLPLYTSVVNIDCTIDCASVLAHKT